MGNRDSCYTLEGRIEMDEGYFEPNHLQLKKLREAGARVLRRNQTFQDNN